MRTAVSAVLDFNHLFKFIYFGGNRKFFFLTATSRALRTRAVCLQYIKIEHKSNEWIN